MSLTINNTVAQQQSLPAQVATPQATTPAAPGTGDGSSAAGGKTAASEPSASLISGNATLTSDLLSVLLQEQSGGGTSFGSLASSGATPSGGQDVTLAGILDQQDQASQNQLGSIEGLDPAAAAQSATSTSDVMGGLQDLLDQLAL